ncbi:MAG TPA: alpha/beta fold hydrolase [Solirubrobacteraceae bacterium]|nr:alpha/beta fold hydrolase [Solirubrobacteraceae bacterium]
MKPRGAGATTRVFVVATVVALVHALDDAFVHRGAGLGLTQHALAGLVALAAGVAAIVWFPKLRPGLRAAVALTFGGLALTNGMLHVNHIRADGLAGGDVTGVLAAVAGVVLIGLAAVIPWRHRGEGTWASRAIAVPAMLLAVVFVLGPVGMGIVSSHKWREPVGEPPSAAYQEVAFEASDGLDLSGWYRPSENGAAVVVLHGGSSDRKGSLNHARLLARHGYGVLVYDARGRGESDGSENNYGWDWAKDLSGALAFLKGRDDVDPARIGAVGLSTGADVLLEAAGERDDIAAVVTDGAAAGSFADWQRLRGTELASVPGWVMFSTIRLLSGDAPGPALEDQMPRIESPTLLISAGTDAERDFNVLYDEAAPDGPVEHWNLPDATHTHAIHDEPEEYERRVASFFDRTLSVSEAR